ncbi:MAG: SDR family oxidoreductase [Ignavibacteria bacterium]|nr:SDR family oxidoreductase [Ignavibacteria bacterium]
MTEKNKKTVLITGANKGIGFETAKQLGAMGFEVFLTARNKGNGETAVMKLKRKGMDCKFIQMDVTEISTIRIAYEVLSKSIEHLDVLINNAGIMPTSSGLLDTTPAVMHNIINTNTLGPLFTAQTFLPLMKKGGRIINVSSSLGKISGHASDYASAYSISKTALNAVTLKLSAALKDKGIVVNSVCPGWVRTDMGGKNAERPVEKGAETIVWLAAEAPLEITGKFIRDMKEIDF